MKKIPTMFLRDQLHPSVLLDIPHPDCLWVFRGEGRATRKYDRLISHIHDVEVYDDVPRTVSELRDWLSSRDIEGLVFQHPDGRMAKIKKRDFGLPRKPDNK